MLATLQDEEQHVGAENLLSDLKGREQPTLLRLHCTGEARGLGERVETCKAATWIFSSSNKAASIAGTVPRIPSRTSDTGALLLLSLENSLLHLDSNKIPLGDPI